jgi:murein L,D-transpeptidase YcbB/YkuD
VGAKETGWMDEPTLVAVKAFQSWAGLVPDGVVGVKTFAALSRRMP